MKKVEVIIKASKLDDVKDAVHSMGVQGMTVTEVKGLSGQKGHNEIYRGLEYVVDFVPQIKIEMVVPSSIVDQLIEKVISATRTGAIEDDKIFVLPIETAVRIRTGERKFDRLFQNDSSADVRRFFGGEEEIYDGAALLAPTPTPPCRMQDATGFPYAKRNPRKTKNVFNILKSCHI